MIELESRDEVFVLHMRDGENRFHPSFVDTFHQALDRVEKAPGPAALVTTGEGKFWSNGLDLAWLGSAGAEAFGPYLDRVHGLFARVLAFPAFTVAALNGHAFAGGAMLALAHDLRVMRSDRGYLCLPEVDLGLPLQPAMTALIRSRLPAQTAHEAIVTGRRYGAADALAAGFVQHAVSENEVLERAVALAREGAGKRRDTMAALKRDLYRATLALLESPAGRGA